jgi:hypothetical protein
LTFSSFLNGHSINGARVIILEDTRILEIHLQIGFCQIMRRILLCHLKTLSCSVLCHILDENEQPPSVNEYIDLPVANILHPSGHVVPTPLLTIMEDVETLKSMSLASPAASVDGSIHHDSETNVDNDPHLHHLSH